MNVMMRRFLKIIVLLSAVCTVCAAISVPNVSLRAADAFYPSLFIDDFVWYKDNSSPAVIKDNKVYVPCEAIGRLQGYYYESDSEAGAFRIRKGDISLSCDVATGVSVSREGDRKYPVFISDNGVYYISVQDVSAVFGFAFEKYAYSNEKIAVRIRDEGGGMSFSAIISAYESPSRLRTDSAPAAELEISSVLLVLNEEDLEKCAGTDFSDGTVCAISTELIIGMQSGVNAEYLTGLFSSVLEKGNMLAIYDGFEDKDEGMHRIWRAGYAFSSVFKVNLTYVVLPQGQSADTIYDFYSRGYTVIEGNITRIG